MKRKNQSPLAVAEERLAKAAKALSDAQIAFSIADAEFFQAREALRELDKR